MAHIGSVFLGDHQRLRVLSSSTPPSSPPSSMAGFFPNLSSPHSPWISDTKEPDPDATKYPPAPVIDPVLSLELRLRWLEVTLLSAKQDTRDRKGKDREKERELEHGETLLRMAENIQSRLDSAVQSNEGLKRFMDHYDQHAHLLTPTFALSGSSAEPPSYKNLSAGELDALLTEMESDIRAADRDMREIETLEKKGVTGAGKLADYEALQPRLDALLKARQEDAKLMTSLERRIAALVERHATHADALSELFVVWDDTLTETEDKVFRLEREKEERRRLGLE